MVGLRDLFKHRDEFDLTEGGIGWPLFYLSLPIVVTNLLQTAYNLADTFWVGQLSGDAPLAAISFAFPMVFLFISLGLGLSVAGSVLVAQHTGAGEEREAEYAASQTVVFSVLGSMLIGGVGYLVVGDVLAVLGAEPAVLPLATAYMQVISLGLPLLFGFFVFMSLMRGYGDTITPMLVMLGAVVLNVVLDPFVIYGIGPFPRMGVAGAAYATVFARGLAMAVGLGIMLRGVRGVRIRPRAMVPDLSYLGKLLRIGVPASIEGTSRALSVNALLFIVGTFPTAVVAAFGVGTRVFSVIFLPAVAVARGVETMTGQNVGADRFDRARATNDFAARTMFLILSAAAVVVFLAAPAIVDVFATSPAVVAEGANFLRVVAPTFGFIGIMRAYTGGLRGAGRTLTAAAISVLMVGIVRLPAAWAGAVAFGTTGLWASFVVSNAVGASVAFLWFRRGTWRGTGLTDSSDGPAGSEADTDVETVAEEADPDAANDD